MSCPHCQEAAKFVDYRSCPVTTLLGKVFYQRAYYHCSHCHQGWFPTDAEFDVSQKQTRGARDAITLVATLEPFAESAHKVLARLTGLTVSASTVQRTAEAVGNHLAGQRAAGKLPGPRRAWDWHRDKRGRRVRYVSLDATAVLQQGLHGEKAESRMPWVGSVFNPPPLDRDAVPEPQRPRRISDTRYVSGLMSLEEIGRQLRAECEAVGLSQVDVAIGLTDGGNGLEDCLIQQVFAGLVKEFVLILDFFHVSEHLGDFAKLWCAEDAARRTQKRAWCHTLKHQGGEVLLRELSALDVSLRTPDVQEAHRLLTNYLRNNLHRLDYPTYLANGWQIGSGEIESACKGVIGLRLKGTGMRWREFGTTALCHLRALYKGESSLWEYYWTHTLTS